MPRRPPPSALRLVAGPTPPRYNPKHILPSLPQPIHHPIPGSSSSAHATPRKSMERRTRKSQDESPQIEIPLVASGTRSGNTSPDSAGSHKREKPLRGPWDHSGSISLDFNVESVLAPLKPVAVSPGSSGSW